MAAYILVSDRLELSVKGQQGQVLVSRYACFKYPYFSSEMNSFVSWRWKLLQFSEELWWKILLALDTVKSKKYFIVI